MMDIRGLTRPLDEHNTQRALQHRAMQERDDLKAVRRMAATAEGRQRIAEILDETLTGV